jgi:putative tricarboxylic transport membrane protein
MLVRRDVSIGVALLVLAAVTLLGVRGLPITHKGTGFGPGAFPLIIGIGLVLLGLAQIIKPLFSRNGSASMQKEGGKTQRKPLLILLATALYIGLIGRLGFVVSTIMFLFITTRIVGEKSYLVSAAYAGAFACLCYLFFNVWLRVALPG